MVETHQFAHIFAVDRKAARDQRAKGAVGPHGGDQFHCPGIDLDIGPQLFHRRCVQPFEHAHPLDQGFREIEFAAHGPRGKVGDPVGQAKLRRQFVDHLVVDDRGLHVGDQQLLAPAIHRLGDEIDGLPVQRIAHTGRGLERRHFIEGDIAGAAGGQPCRVPGPGAGRRQRIARRGHHAMA